MSDCCAGDKLQRKILWIVFWVNAIAFLGQFSAAIIAHSSALLSDSLDMLGDMLAYAISLYALGRGAKWLAGSALFKGAIITVFATAILLNSIYKLLGMPILPSSKLMLIFASLGLVANGYCYILLSSQRDTDINMRSVWICSRNDVLVNISVLLTAGLVYFMQSRYPDIIVGSCLALMLFYSGAKIIHAAVQQLRQGESVS